MKQYAVIVAGGRGLRMQAEIPKQFLNLNGSPVLMHTIEVLNRALAEDAEIILVLPDDQISFWNSLCVTYNFQIKHSIVEGGKTRFESVKNGLNTCVGQGIVGIHDGVRPLVTESFIQHCFAHAQRHGSALPVVSINQSLRKRLDDGDSKPVDRDGMVSVQTPQCFDLSAIKKAYEQGFHPRFTDDASVFEADGNRVSLVDGEPTNIKITTPQDMKIAEAITKSSAQG
ncbi:MAG: 2-C-methyl-D-erythritol 4-phosphate cytidylyltransferase [Salibacteraceae bacterium]